MCPGENGGNRCKGILDSWLIQWWCIIRKQKWHKEGEKQKERKSIWFHLIPLAADFPWRSKTSTRATNFTYTLRKTRHGCTWHACMHILMIEMNDMMQYIFRKCSPCSFYIEWVYTLKYHSLVMLKHRKF